MTSTVTEIPTFVPSTFAIEKGQQIGWGESRHNADLLIVTGQFGWIDRYALIGDHTGELTWRRECGRCGNFRGHLAEYGHVFSGVCFSCNGRGYAYSRSVKTPQAAQARLDRQVRKEIARLEQVEADRPAMEAREREIRAEIVAKAELSAYAEAERRGTMRAAGEVGERITVTGEVVTAFYLEAAQYGWSSSMLLVIACGNGVTVKAKTSASWAFEVKKGQTVTVAGTVTGTEDYRGTLQTVITRPKRIG